MGASRRDKTRNDPESLGLAAFRQPPTGAGVALDQLSAALASMLNSGSDPYQSTIDPASAPSLEAPEAPTNAAAEPAGADDESPATKSDAGEVSPRSILEAMLFVGGRDNQPLTNKQVAALMRGVRPAEIDALVRELNEGYDSRRCPYHIVAEGAGYRLTLRDEFSAVRDRFYTKARQARLSQAAVEILATVAYRGSLTSEEITQLRGRSSGSILLQLVRRQLLKVEHTDTRPRRMRYSTTPRFLTLFGLESLEDLPRSGDLEERTQ